jgi:hypothetical protein
VKTTFDIAEAQAQLRTSFARCVFAEKRAVVYELFAEILHGPSSTS